MTVAARALDLPSVVVLSLAGLVLLGACCLSAWSVPAVFLGPDGRWMLATTTSLLRTRRGGGSLMQAADSGEAR